MSYLNRHRKQRRWTPAALVSSVRQRLKQCPDSDLEQNTLRVFTAALIIVYLSVRGAYENTGDSLYLHRYTSQAYVLFGLVILLSLLAFPRESRVRRLFGMFVDLSFVSYILYAGGPIGAPLFFVYYWVVVGNGFRWGLMYLYSAMFVSLVEFGAVFAFSEYWAQRPNMAAGIFLGLVVVPLFVSRLIQRLNEALERAEKASQAKTSFLANMSHELRTPLNGVIGMTDLLIGTRLNRHQKDYAETIQASANALLSLVDDILDISKIEVGKAAIENTDCELPMLVESTVKMLKPQALEKGLYLRVDISPQIPVIVQGDPQHLRQVLINLIGNAIKFTDSGGIEVRLTKTNEGENTAIIRFEVIDTGIGIPVEAQKNIFDTFSQADQSVTRRYGGTGLGTAISKQLIELMGGEIGLQSSPGQGSRFWFAIEFSLPEAGSQSIGKAKGLGAKRMLVVSERGGNHSAVAPAASHWVTDLVWERGLDDSLLRLKEAALDKRPFDIIVVEGPLNTIDPLDFVHHVRSSSDLGRASMVAVLENLDEDSQGALKRAGYDQVLVLPVDKTVLFNVLHQVSVTTPDSSSDRVARLIDYYPRSRPLERKLRILVAEDNPVNQKVVRKILERAGHDITVVENGEEALEALESEDIDVAIVDMHMPVLGGLDAIKIYRLAHPNHRMSFVVLTANATTEAKRECENAGVDAFLTKPIQATQLLNKINEITSEEGRTAVAEPENQAIAVPVSDAKVTDRTRLAELDALSPVPGFVHELVDVFLADAERLLGEMRYSRSRGELQGLRELAHAFKGGAASIGADRLYVIGQKLNDLKVAQFSERAAPLLEEAAQELECVRKELLSYLESRNSERSSS